MAELKEAKLKAYGDLRDLIFRGFLTYNFTFDKTRFVFKTLNKKEFDQIQCLLHGIDDEDELQFYRSLYFLSYSVYMVEGINVLKDRVYYLNKLQEFMKELPSKIVFRWDNRITRLQNDLTETQRYMEGFSYTEQSRKYWKTINGSYPNLEEFTGIPGTTELGMNIFQESWVSINRTIDDEEDYDTQFSLAVLIASASNPKGAKKLQSSYNAQKTELNEKRQKIAHFGYREAEYKSRAGWTAPTDTREELVAEMLRQIHGKKDKHDKVVDLYFDGLITTIEEREAEQAKRAEAARKERGDAPIVGSTRVLTPKESEELMKRKPKTTITVPSEEQVNREDKSRIFSKIGSRVLSQKKG